MKTITTMLLLLALAVPAQAQDSHKAAKIGWTIVLGSVASYELWAIKSKHETLSQGVQRGGKGFKIGLGIGLGVVAVHLYVGKR